MRAIRIAVSVGSRHADAGSEAWSFATHHDDSTSPFQHDESLVSGKFPG
jgi:hypothetical protein